MKIIFFILLFLLLGTVLQYALTKIEEAKYPPPGKMVDIGGYSLHIYDTGEGSGPTIVLDMGLGGNVLYWSLVQSKISKFARVVSYDRGGIGWSDRSPLPRTNENITKELHELLHRAKIPGPYIFVGHSFAGIIARVYANKYPGEVVGVVLVDSSNEYQTEGSLPRPTDFLSRLLDFAPMHPLVVAFSRIGLHRIFHLYNGESHAFDIKTRRAMVAKNSSVKFIKALLEEWGAFESNLKEARANKYLLGDIPLIVITAAMDPSPFSCAAHGHATADVCNIAYKAWHELQKDLTTKSRNSKQIMAYKSTHLVQKCEPEIIVEAVASLHKG